MNKQLKALIVDDEALARQDLISILSDFKYVDIIGEAKNIKSAVHELKNNSPDIIFLDIQLPGESGFDLLDHINPKIKIIFVTAFDEYAKRAFEVNALDYLTKPVHKDRLANALEKLEHNSSTNFEEAEKLNYEDSLFLKLHDSYHFLKINTILKIESNGDYSEIVTKDGKKKLVHKKMKEWEIRLPYNNFCRVHRSTIVNLSEIIKVVPMFNQTYHVYITGLPKPVIMSRRYFSVIKDKFK